MRKCLCILVLIVSSFLFSKEAVADERIKEVGKTEEGTFIYSFEDYGTFTTNLEEGKISEVGYLEWDDSLTVSISKDGKNVALDESGLIFENGLGPYLEQQRVDFPIVISGRVYSLNVAFPVFMCNASQWNALDVRSGSVQRQTQELVCMDDVFGADFKAERNRIVARTIATVAIRQAASIAANEALLNRYEEIKVPLMIELAELEKRLI